MTDRLWKLFAGLGVPGVALGVFYSLYNKIPIVGNIPPDKMFIVILVFMAATAVVVIFALYIVRPQKIGEQIVHRYDRLKEGLSSPEQNISLIQEIANSTDPNKQRYLQEFLDCRQISFLEMAAAKFALEDLSHNKKVTDLFERSKKGEMQKLLGMRGATGDAVLDATIINLKFWRFCNRRNHPRFNEVETAIANALTFQNPEQIVNALKSISS